jgi:radical SAM protein with 4Fe4S-binding SPASM domain
MEASDFARLTDILSGAGIGEIDILGGEPTLHTELDTLIEIAFSRGFSISMSTNGSNVPVLIRLSEEFDRSRLAVGISLNGKPPGEELSAYIKGHKPLLKSVCTKQLFMPESAPGFLGIPGIRYYAIFMDTLSAADLENSLSFPQYYMALQSVQRKFENVEGVFCSGFITDNNDPASVKNFRCPAGTEKLSVMPDGSAYPCYLLFGRPEFRLGNILNDSLNKILKSPLLGFFRNFEKNNCPESACEYFSVCHGGCPALSLMLYGDLDAADPRCSNPPC